MTEISYEPGSLLPTLPEERIIEFEEWLNSYWEVEDIRFPSSYKQHLLKYHGGAPSSACFKTAEGKVRQIGRFLNFLDEGDILPGPAVASWRPWSKESDVRFDYRVMSFFDYEFWCVRFAELDELLCPFAGINTDNLGCRDVDEMALLCFDFTDEISTMS